MAKLSKIEELRLVAQCALGDDRRAFATLVEAHQQQVRRLLLNLTCGDAALCDDLAQETFIKAYLGLRQFKGVSSFSTWLYRIACNEFYSHTRHQREQALDAAAAQVPATQASPASDAAIDVQAALRALTATERMVVTLFYLDDLPLKRVAAITSLPQGTVKSHLHRAREKMARFLSETSV